ncbi:MAG: hypothetical protein M3279_11655 [Actinomycetota bacterium]|nr:hypothetical protein [Actinomycetota bacterium]
MSLARRRTAVILAAGALTGLLTVAAPPAQAQGCTSVPGSVPGTDVTILGQQHRIPTISNITVCAGTSSAPLIAVETSGNGYCSTACLSVLLQGDEADAGAVTISYREDGTTRTRSVDPGGVGGGSDSCLLSVGSPDAPYPSCAVAIGPDGLPGIPPVPGPLPLPDNPLCETYYEDPPGSGNWVSFCDDPAGGIRYIFENVQQFCEEGNCTPRAIRCLVLAVLGQEGI